MKRFSVIGICLFSFSLVASEGTVSAGVIISDHFTSVTPDSTNLFATDTFTSNAAVGGPLVYTVNAGSVYPTSSGGGFVDFFGGLETSSDMFVSFATNSGTKYTVSFDALQIGAPSSHQLAVTAFDAVGLGGTVLGSSGGVGINSSGSFEFDAIGNMTTIRVLGVLGSPNSSSDIAFTNFVVDANTVPEPSSCLMFVAVLVGACTSRRKRK